MASDEKTAVTASEILGLMTDPQSEVAFIHAIRKAFQGKPNFSTPFNIDQVGALAAALDSHEYATENMLEKPRFQDRLRLMDFCVKQKLIEGPILEFGVWSGRTINFMASALPTRKLFGFDSFEGLPEGWFTSTAGKGQFNREGKPPEVKPNVELVVGWFDRTLPVFLDAHAFDQIAILHVDCDIYSSTQTIFAHLHSKIAVGTVIIFDEYYNYPTWRRHEYAAFQEYCNFRQVKYEYIGLVPAGEQVAVRILAK